MAPSKRPRTRASKRATKPTYAQLEQRNAQLESQIAQLKEQALEAQRLRVEVTDLKARLAEDARGAADEDDGAAAEEILTVEEQQGRKWKELFVSSDVFREHIQPELGETWTAILMEACGQATSKTTSQVERKTMSAKDATQSVALYEWSCARGLEGQVQHNEAHVTKQEARQALDELEEQGVHNRIGQDLLKWDAGDEGGAGHRVIMRAAALWGNISLIKILYENGSPWDEETCEHAAKGGHLNVLKYLHENGCPWNDMTCFYAAYGGHLSVLKYAHENGCPWDEKTCRGAAEGGHLNVLKYARGNGCPWDAYTCQSKAIKGGHTHVLEWIHAQEGWIEWGEAGGVE